MGGFSNVIMWEPGEKLEALEERVIKAQIAYCDGDKRGAAVMLGISYQTVLNKLEGYHQRDKDLNQRRKIQEQIMNDKCKVADGEMPERLGGLGSAKPSKGS